MEEIKVLNIYKHNIYQVLNFMFKIKKNMTYINGFKNSAKTSLLCLKNEIIYF